MHRVTYEQLVAEGVDLTGLRHQRLGLSLNGEWVPLGTVGQGGGRGRLFGPGSYLEFYAEKADSLYRKEQVYVLHVLTNQERANRINIPQFRTRVNPRLPVATSYWYTLHVEQDNTYDFSAPSITDPFHFGQTFSLYATPSYQFDVADLAAGAGNSAELKVEMYGLVDFDIEGNDHHFEVLVNGVLVGDQQFDGNASTTLEAQNVPINAGSNTIKYNYRSIEGVPFDRITLNEFEVRYRREADAGGGAYLNGYVDAQQLEVRNFAGSKASVYRRLGNGRVEKLHDRSIESTADRVVFSTGAVAADYMVIGESGYHAAEIHAIEDFTDISSGMAEYLIIAHPSLLGEAMDELVALRSQDYLVKVVDVEAVFAQYGHHQFGPEGIQAYVRHAAANMGTKMVVLVGNDTLDYKQHTSQSVSLIPTRYVSTPGGALTITQTPSDVAYGDLDNNGVPELVVARIPARTPAELANVVAKIKAYEAREGYVGRTAIVADKDDLGNGVSFYKDAQAMIKAIPDNWSDGVRDDFQIYPDQDGHQQAHDRLIGLLNAGMSVVSYVGHSSQQSWAYTSPPMLRAAEVASLTNFGKPAVVTQWGCWNAYFVDTRGNTISDALLLHGENGAASVLGASTLTSSIGDRSLGVELNKRVYVRGKTLGEAMLEAKQALAAYADYPDIQLGLHLLGDPALKVNF
ncbi:hypothetical protein GCM10008090_06920 [Arenicella chitinivorans]|uniref:Gingipain domain-containing protein n=2 Tax=Arenicella chitinivorans TaxID=1329800 RepID=A0A918RM89_9GAMM|nr:hypothetical protein GCM10008090_06920 [Arenicella chitinivorans]